MDFTIKQGDTRTALKATLYNPTGSVVDLSYTTVQFILSDHNSILLTKTPVIQDAEKGIVWVIFAANDLANVSGWLRGEIRVTFNDDKVETFPNNGYIKINVVKSL